MSLSTDFCTHFRTGQQLGYSWELSPGNSTQSISGERSSGNGGHLEEQVTIGKLVIRYVLCCNEDDSCKTKKNNLQSYYANGEKPSYLRGSPPVHGPTKNVTGSSIIYHWAFLFGRQNTARNSIAPNKVN